jgi:hypothetical protein
MRARFLGVCLALLAAQGLAWAGSPDPAAPQAPVPGKSAAAPAAKGGERAAKPADKAAAPIAAPAAKADVKPPAPPAAPEKAPAWAGADDSDARFFGELGYKDCATAADAARALVILVSEGKQRPGDFEACKAYLAQRGVLPEGWLDKAKADEPVEKSNLARLVCRAMGVKGGLWMRLLGPLPRLALRECIYHELMPGGADYAYVSGGELVGVIDRCDRWRAKETGRALPKLQTPPAAEENK